MSSELNICLHGGCACGAVRYRLLLEPLIVHACHCRSCQRQSGGYHAVNAVIETHEMELLQGDLRFTQLPTPSGAGQTVAHCAACKVALWSNYHAMSRSRGDIVRFVRVGTLDEPHRLPPDVHIFHGERNTCGPRDESRPRYEGFYNLADVWPPASLQRLYALF